MKYTLSFLLIFTCLNISAQSKWSVGFVSGVDIADTRYKAKSANKYTSVEGRGVLVIGMPLLSPRYGVNFGYRVSDRFEIKSGVRYNDRKFLFDDMGFRFVRYEFTYTSQFVEIPLHLKMDLAKRKWQWFVEGGVSPNILVKSKIRREFGDGELLNYNTESLPGLRKIDVSLDLGIGLETDISDKLCLSLQPMFRYFPLSTSSVGNSQIKAHYYNVGLELGMSYKL